MWRRSSGRPQPAAGRARGPWAQEAATAAPTAPRRAVGAPLACRSPPVPLSAGAWVGRVGGRWSRHRPDPRRRGTACATRVVEPRRSTCLATPRPPTYFRGSRLRLRATHEFGGLRRNDYSATPPLPGSPPRPHVELDVGCAHVRLVQATGQPPPARRDACHVGHEALVDEADLEGGRHLVAEVRVRVRVRVSGQG